MRGDTLWMPSRAPSRGRVPKVCLGGREPWELCLEQGIMECRVLASRLALISLSQDSVLSLKKERDLDLIPSVLCILVFLDRRSAWEPNPIWVLNSSGKNKSVRPTITLIVYLCKGFLT